MILSCDNWHIITGYLTQKDMINLDFVHKTYIRAAYFDAVKSFKQNKCVKCKFIVTQLIMYGI